ncbi:hypothetical protein [Pectobacterium parvum]|uniref:hypothetical protein n=1 Tax=Pectobacterium parvum TaxID=2778550 RepID=UPI002158F22E|nr:hypothetical protein [Pectobacterium parvum]UVD97572.1 hypothetical protein NV347_00525 [Pectobacterium parvum]
MPISQSQYRTSTERYQSKFNKKNIDHVFHKENVNRNSSDNQDSMYNTIPLVNHAKNSPSVLNIQANPCYFRKNAVATTIQLMLLLNYIRPTNALLSTTRETTLSATNNHLQAAEIDDSLPEKKERKRDVTNTYNNKKYNLSNKIDKKIPVNMTTKETYGLKNEVFIKAIDSLVKEHRNALIENNKSKKNNINDIFIKNKTTPDYFRFTVLNHIKKTERIIKKEERKDDDVKIEKIDYTCLEERKNMTLGDILRKIGNTLSNPVSELSQEIQVIYYYEKFGRCASKEKIENLKKATLFADKVISSILSLIPGSNHIVLLQNIGSPLLRLIADDLENKEHNPEDIQNLIGQSAFMAKIIVDSSPKNSNGIVIENEISPPENFIFIKNKPYIKIENKEYAILYNGKGYVIEKNNIEQEVIYSTKEKKWQYSRKGKAWELERKKILFGEGNVYNIIKTENLLSQLSIKNKNYKKTDEINEYNLYYTKQSNGKLLACIKMDNYLVPIRSGGKNIGGVEVYDYKKPNKIGYPIYLGENKTWHFGKKNNILMRSRSNSQLYSNVSIHLKKSIPSSFYKTDLNLHDCNPIDNRGIVKLQYEEKYLRLEDGYVRIRKHPLFPHLFELGSDQFDKILCYFDKADNMFYSVPEEKSISETNKLEKLINENKKTLGSELIIKFKKQVKLKSYREGFRTLDFEDYKKINIIDKNINSNCEKIHFYGLNREETSQNLKYQEVAQNIKIDVINSQEITEKVKRILLKGEKENYIAEYLNKKIKCKNSKESNYILEMLIDKTSKINEVLRKHIDDDCSRVWLVEHKNIDVYGLTNTEDPLSRIYINLKMSDAFIRKNRKNISCKLFCTVPSEGDDIATIIHEASHTGANTIDSFYMARNTLESELERLSTGDMSSNEVRDILNSDAASKAPPYLGSAREQARRLFNNNSDVRGEFLLNNADSLTQIILDIYNKGSKINKRDTQPKKIINAEMLYLFVAQGLSERKHRL